MKSLENVNICFITTHPVSHPPQHIHLLWSEGHGPTTHIIASSHCNVFLYLIIYVFAYNFQDLENGTLWNLFCQVVTLAKDLRHNRFCLRLMMKVKCYNIHMIYMKILFLHFHFYLGNIYGRHTFVNIIISCRRCGVLCTPVTLIMHCTMCHINFLFCVYLLIFLGI